MCEIAPKVSNADLGATSSSHIRLVALTVPLAFGLFVSEVFLYGMGVLDDVAFLRE